MQPGRWLISPHHDQRRRVERRVDRDHRAFPGCATRETWLPSADAGHALRLLQGRQQQQDKERLMATLTPREREVLTCLVAGMGRRDMAERPLPPTGGCPGSRGR
jgi:hypothetical protein